MLKNLQTPPGKLLGITMMLLWVTACQKDTQRNNEPNPAESNGGPIISVSNTSSPILIVVDEESIDNGNKPNNFSETQVNDDISKIGQRVSLRYFRSNIGKTIDLYTGEVGDEGWYALKTIPTSWKNAGPATNGARNYLEAGPGLGGGNDPEKLLDKIPNVTPLRARGLSMLTGQTILAIVYDSDISINYDPLNGSLKGENLGLVALTVQKVTQRTDGSSGSLPKVTVKIEDADRVKTGSLKLFSNAPVPKSSSEPYDVKPPSTIPAIQIAIAL